jgi:hypothetical protein
MSSHEPLHLTLHAPLCGANGRHPQRYLFPFYQASLLIQSGCRIRALGRLIFCEMVIDGS